MPITLDLAAVRAVLEADRPWTAFALADLSPEHHEFTEWHLAEDRSGLVLVYRGFDPPLLFALGDPDSVRPLVAEAATKPEFYLSMSADAIPLVEKCGYEAPDVKTIWRMALDASRFPGAAETGLESLRSEDYEALVRLYADGRERGESPQFFTALMLRTGVYFGVREGRGLVAAAGTHVCAPDLGVADIGNVYTRHDQRRRGFGERLTAAVIAELLRRGARTIVLNVLAENSAAIRIYERLGFVKYRCYREGLARAHRTSPIWQNRRRS